MSSKVIRHGYLTNVCELADGEYEVVGFMCTCEMQFADYVSLNKHVRQKTHMQFEEIVEKALQQVWDELKYRDNGLVGKTIGMVRDNILKTLKEE